MRHLRVLVVDSSTPYRTLVVEAVNETRFSRVVATAADGQEALARFDETQPDLITIDLALPIVDGLALLRTLRDRGSLPMVLVVTAETKSAALDAVEALERGAIGVVMKPPGDTFRSSRAALVARLQTELEVASRWVRTPASRSPEETQERTSPRDSVGRGSSLRIAASTTARPSASAVRTGPSGGRVEPAPAWPVLVAIGASTGGPAALVAVVSALPATLACPVVIVQHMPPVFTPSLAASLARHAQVPVVEAAHRRRLEPGTVYVAPGGRHLRIATTEAGFLADLGDDAPVHFCRPSCDVLFRSAADAARARAIGVLLTGMGEDGAQGLLAMRVAGCQTLAQDEATSVVYGMPRAAAALGAAREILPIEKIGPSLAARVPRKMAALRGPRP